MRKIQAFIDTGADSVVLKDGVEKKLIAHRELLLSISAALRSKLERDLH